MFIHCVFMYVLAKRSCNANYDSIEYETELSPMGYDLHIENLVGYSMYFRILIDDVTMCGKKLGVSFFFRVVLRFPNDI